MMSKFITALGFHIDRLYINLDLSKWSVSFDVSWGWPSPMGDRGVNFRCLVDNDYSRVVNWEYEKGDSIYFLAPCFVIWLDWG